MNQMDIFEYCAKLYLSLEPEDFDQEYAMKLIKEEIDDYIRKPTL
jgi:hypothetical protein